ncbi:MerR family transcriptional regulator [Desulfovibrio mangrovi]|uniref:MerR family transcriptional regulator n=1 Tax=Desulfovibrio mangrovi TaxID=2976983 RepID=UPI002245687A|nr:GyrI-like domain-containing protein [Desulfovibrio mangrovi]UZP66769.1 MerR family transcriptional regulator [Desulfovibrio mangrovi]
MKSKIKYSIGDVSRICNISKKALRYYDNIDLITSQRQDYNNYRYYTYESLLAVPVIKYYKQMGFKLEEMRDFIEGKTTSNVYKAIKSSFTSKIEELEKLQEDIRRQYVSVKDWYDLISEAEMVLENDIREVSIKFVESSEYMFQEQEFDNDIKGAIINIEWTNYVESQNNEITGPVILNFSSLKSRMQNKPQHIRILQKTLMPAPETTRVKLGGYLMASCYHIGTHDTLHETYSKICRWANKFGYALGEETYERYVTDYWTTRNDSQFVTEILIKATRQGAVA